MLDTFTILENEIKKCKKEPDYFYYTYYKVDGASPRQPDRYSFKDNIFGSLKNKSKNLLITKPRQMGITNLLLGFAIHHVLFERDVRVHYISFPGAEFSHSVSRFLETNLEQSLRFVLARPTRKSNRYIELSNGSYITFQKSTNWFRSMSFTSRDLVVLDDSFLRHPATGDIEDVQIYSAIFPDAKFVVANCPTKKGDCFHNFVNHNKKNPNWDVIELSWLQNPSFTKEDIKDHIRLVGQERSQSSVYGRFLD